MCLSVKIFGPKWEISVEIFHPLSGGQTLGCSSSIKDEKNKLIYFPLPLSYRLHNTYNKSFMGHRYIFVFQDQQQCPPSPPRHPLPPTPTCTCPRLDLSASCEPFMYSRVSYPTRYSHMHMSQVRFTTLLYARAVHLISIVEYVIQLDTPTCPRYPRFRVPTIHANAQCTWYKSTMCTMSQLG